MRRAEDAAKRALVVEPRPRRRPKPQLQPQPQSKSLKTEYTHRFGYPGQMSWWEPESEPDLKASKLEAKYGPLELTSRRETSIMREATAFRAEARARELDERRFREVTQKTKGRVCQALE